MRIASLLILCLVGLAQAGDRESKVATALAGKDAESERERKVKAALALAGGPTVVTAAPKPIEWRTDYAAGMAEAKKSGKPVFIMFTGPDCKHCKVTEATTLKDKRVVSLLEQAIPIKLEADDNRSLAKALGVTILPSFVLIDKAGIVREVMSGLQETKEVLTHLGEVVGK